MPRYYGTIGLFLSLIFLFIRVLPALSITEVRELAHEDHEVRHRLHELQHAAPGEASA